MSQHASYLVGLTIEGLIIVAVVATVVAIVTTRRRERAQARAYLAATLADLPPGFDYPRTPDEHVERVVHDGAASGWSPKAELARILRTVAQDTPVEHEGATEEYGDELHAAGQALPSADLRTTGEQMVADHAELAGISDALDQCTERVMHDLRLFLRDLPDVYLRVARWGSSTTEDTGTFPVVRAELAEAGAR